MKTFLDFGIDLKGRSGEEVKKTYVPKAPCKKCGSSLRFKSNYGCVECLRGHSRKYHADHREQQLERMKAWTKENADKNRANSRRWYDNNKAKAAELRNKYRANRWDEHYRLIYRAYSSKRRAALLQRTPAWADFDAIASFYAHCPVGFHVDHEVPLIGKTVCGLHVIENLQYLPALENLKKGNRYE